MSAAEHGREELRQLKAELESAITALDARMEERLRRYHKRLTQALKAFEQHPPADGADDSVALADAVRRLGEELKQNYASADQRAQDRLRRHQKRVLRELETLQRGTPAAVRGSIGNVRLEIGRLDYPGAEILMRLSSARTVQRLRSCEKEPWTVAWIEEWVGAGDVLYDIGANVGAYALVAACKPNPAGRVIALEPGATTYATLQENIAINGVDDVVVALPVAVAAETSLLFFHYRDLEAGGASHTISDARDKSDSPAVLTQPMLTYRLDDLVETFGLPSPVHVKLDVDGSEPEVLRGAERSLRETVASAMVEMQPQAAPEVERLLAEAGLSLVESFPVQDEHGVRSYWYALFARGGARQ